MDKKHLDNITEKLEEIEVTGGRIEPEGGIVSPDIVEAWTRFRPDSKRLVPNTNQSACEIMGSNHFLIKNDDSEIDCTNWKSCQGEPSPLTPKLYANTGRQYMDKKQQEEITGKLEEIDVTGGIDFCTSTQPVQNAIRSHALYNSGKFAKGIANETPRPNDALNRLNDPNNKDLYSDLNVRGGGLD